MTFLQGFWEEVVICILVPEFVISPLGWIILIYSWSLIEWYSLVGISCFSFYFLHEIMSDRLGCRVVFLRDKVYHSFVQHFEPYIGALLFCFVIKRKYFRVS